MALDTLVLQIAEKANSKAVVIAKIIYMSQPINN